MRMRPTFSTTNKRPVPLACKSTGRCKPETIPCHVYAAGTGNVVVPGAVSVGVAGLDVSVAGTGPGVSVSISEGVVGGMEVCVRGPTVGVFEGGVVVTCPLHAATNNTNKSIKRF